MAWGASRGHVPYNIDALSGLSLPIGRLAIRLIDVPAFADFQIEGVVAVSSSCGSFDENPLRVRSSDSRSGAWHHHCVFQEG